MTAKYGMVINLERCVGCYACVVACKQCWGTRPGVNYNEMNYVEWGEFPDAHQRYLSTMCNHCENAPCVGNCPTGASIKTEEGPVIVDFSSCIGCGTCVEACPYGHRYLVESDMPTSFEDTILPCEEESSKRSNVAEKCTFCYERLAEGKQPMCTVHCPGQCRIFGDLNDPESEVSLYIAEKNPVHIEGTSMYYVVPEGMDRSLLPANLADAIGGTAEASSDSDKSASKSEPSIPVAGVAGAAVVAAAAAGGVAYARSKKKTPTDQSE